MVRGCKQSIAMLGNVLLVNTDELDENGFTLQVDGWFHEQSFYYDTTGNPSVGYLAGISVHVQTKNFNTRVDNDTALIDLFKDKLLGQTDNFYAYFVDDYTPEYLLAYLEAGGDYVSMTVQENKWVKHDEDVNVAHRLTELVKAPSSTSIRGITAINVEPACYQDHVGRG